MSDKQELIDKILDDLHIDTIARRYEYVHNMVRERWEVKKYRPKDYHECHRYLAKYYSYHFATALRVDVVVPPERAFYEVRRILDKAQGGFAGHIGNAVRGRHGGMKALVDLIAEELKNEAIEQYITYTINIAIDNLDWNMRIELMRQYLKRYSKHMLPGEYMKSPEELAASYESVIKYHMQMVNSYRNIIQ
jgi:hypothetical protein